MVFIKAIVTSTIVIKGNNMLVNVKCGVFFIKDILIIVDICIVINKETNGIIITKSRAYDSFTTSSSPKNTNK